MAKRRSSAVNEALRNSLRISQDELREIFTPDVLEYIRTGKIPLAKPRNVVDQSKPKSVLDVVVTEDDVERL